MNYQEKLRDPRWQKKRLEIFQRDNWACVCCDKKDVTLHVHHLFYLPGVEPWEYNDDHLVTYCENCHNSEHLIGNQLNECLIDIIKENRLLIKPIAQICVLAEKHDAFQTELKDFLNKSMMSYLQAKKFQSTYAKSNVETMDDVL